MNRFPGNKTFAFSIFDDTDWSTAHNSAPVYKLLLDLGIHTTKSVWPLAEVSGARIGGSSLQDEDYLKFVRFLQNEGFEIGLHNVRNHDSPREIVERGFEVFGALLGRNPAVHCNHSMNRENIYWGSERIGTGAVRLAYDLATRFKRRDFFQGHVDGSEFFWGDLCKENITYVRNFVFNQINLDRINPTMPYHDPRTPFVNYWFSSCEGDTVESFCKMLREENQDRLAAENGVCIMYTHFGKGFARNGSLHPEFERLMKRLSKKNGWFVPVSTLLDFLRESRATAVIPRSELRRMESTWLMSKLRNGTS